MSQAALDKVKNESFNDRALRLLPPCKSATHEEWAEIAKKLRADYGDRVGFQIWMAWCESDDARFNDNIAQAAWTKTAVPVITVAPRKMTMAEERLTRLLSIRTDKVKQLQEDLYWSYWWRNAYAVVAIAGWFCLIIYSAFGGPEV